MDHLEAKGWAGLPLLRKSTCFVGFAGILYQGTKSNMLGPLSHLYSQSLYLGSTVWVTFFSGLIMYKNMDVKSFGILQSHLFPPYFIFQSVSNLITLCCQISIQNGDPMHSSTTPIWVALACSLLNWLVFGPWSIEVMFEKHKLLEGSGYKVGDDKTDKKEEIRKRLPKIAEISKKFGMLHGASSLLNMIGLIGMLYHGYQYVSSR